MAIKGAVPDKIGSTNLPIDRAVEGELDLPTLSVPRNPKFMVTPLD